MGLLKEASSDRKPWPLSATFGGYDGLVATLKSARLSLMQTSSSEYALLRSQQGPHPEDQEHRGGQQQAARPALGHLAASGTGRLLLLHPRGHRHPPTAAPFRGRHVQLHELVERWLGRLADVLVLAAVAEDVLAARLSSESRLGCATAGPDRMKEAARDRDQTPNRARSLAESHDRPHLRGVVIPVDRFRSLFITLLAASPRGVRPGW